MSREKPAGEDENRYESMPVKYMPAALEEKYKRGAYYVCFIFFAFFKHNSFLHIRYVNLLQQHIRKRGIQNEIQNKF